MARRGLRGRVRDVRLLALVVANALFIGVFLASQLGADEQGGWRRIDTEAVEAGIRNGDLTRHEALFYHREGEEPETP